MEASNPSQNPEVVARESRLMLPAGILALVGVALIVASTLLRQSAGKIDGVTEAAKLRQFADLGTSAVIGDAIALFGLLLLIFPLFFLFQAAAARAPRVRRGFAMFVIIGPLLLGVQGLVGTIARESIGDEYVKEFPVASPDENRKSDESNGDSKTDSTSSSNQATDSQTTKESGSSSKSDATASSSASGESRESAREKRAKELIDGSQAIQITAVLGLVGALAFVFAMVYTSLWSFRTGLLTRFWGTLGMALGVALVFLGSMGFLGLLIWFAVLGLMFVGIFPGGRPPAWTAGVAIPWPKPEPRKRPDDDAVEGSGREIEGESKDETDARQLESGEDRSDSEDQPKRP